MTRWVTVSLVLTLTACEPEPSCDEDIRAQVVDERVDVMIGDRMFEAELADEPVERERGWKHRRCDRVAILLVPDTPSSSLPIWGCGLTSAIDAAFIANAEVVALERIEPCAEPCAACPSFAADIEVDAVLEVPAGDLAGLGVGDPTSL